MFCTANVQQKMLFIKRLEMTDEELQLVCAVCLKPAQSRCSKCHVTKYCSRECQQQDWSTHKIKCKSSSKSTQ